MRANRVDRNHNEILEQIRAFGCAVQPLTAQKGGVADLMCLYRRHYIFLVEVKDGPKAKLTPDQVEWHKVWPVYVVRDSAECAAMLRGLDRIAGIA